MKALRAIYRYWMTLIVVAILVQIGSAGYGAFYAAHHLKDKTGNLSRFTHKGWDHGWNFHSALGWLTVFAILIALLLAIAARVGRPRIWWQLGLAVAGVLQIVFALGGESTPAVGVLHPLNALLLAALAGQIAAREWRSVRHAAA